MRRVRAVTLTVVGVTSSRSGLSGGAVGCCVTVVFMSHLDVDRHALGEPEHGLARLQPLDLRVEVILHPVDPLDPLLQRELRSPHGLQLLFLPTVATYTHGFGSLCGR